MCGVSFVSDLSHVHLQTTIWILNSYRLDTDGYQDKTSDIYSARTLWVLNADSADRRRLFIYYTRTRGRSGGWARFAVAHAADFLVLYPLPTSAYPSFCYSLPEQIDDSCHGKGNEKLH